MTKLIICDDEPWVCTLIQNCIDFRKNDIELVGFAHDGLGALEMIKEKQPDIAIVDIMMPGIDGVELIKKAWEDRLPVKFIIVSGCNSFDYARKAIKYQVSDYLLKPIDKEAVEEAVSKLCAVVNRENEDRVSQTQTLIRLEHTASIAKKYFLSNIIFNTNVISGLSMEDVNREYDTRFENGLFQFFLLGIQSDKNRAQTSEDVNRVEDWIKKAMSEICITCESYVNRNQVVLLVNYKPEELGRIEKMAEHYFNDFLENYSVSLFMKAIMVVGSPTAEFGAISDMYKKTTEMIPAGIMRGYNCVISYSEVDESHDLPSNIPSESHINAIRSSIDSCDREKFRSGIRMILYLCRDDICMNPRLFFLMVERIVKTISDYLNIDGDDSRKLIEPIEHDYTGNENIEGLSEMVTNIIFPSVRSFYERKNNEKSLPLMNARHYIEENYAQDVTLESLAEAVYVSPGYLSTLFKKEMDKTFVAYLTDVRIKKAKQLLARPEYSISDIARMTGYADAKYFSKVFYKNVNLKPKEYRRICSSIIGDEKED